MCDLDTGESYAQVWFRHRGVTVESYAHVWFRHRGVTRESWAPVWFRHRGVTRESWAQVWFRHRGVLPLSVNVKYIKIVTLIQIVIKIDPCPRIHSLFLI